MKITVPSKYMLIAMAVVCTMSFGCSKTNAKDSGKSQTVLENIKNTGKNKIVEAKPVPKVRDTSPNPVSDFEYDLYGDDSEEVIIKKYKGTRTDVVIPKEIEGLPVTVIGERAFYTKSDLTSVVLPDTIRKIQDSAFFGRKLLEEVNFPASLEQIGSDSFSKSGIKKIKLTKSMLEGSQLNFDSCFNLSEVEFEEGITEITCNFSNCYALQHIKLPASVKSLKTPSGLYRTKFDYSGLIDIEFPEEMEKIEGLFDATSGCLHLSVDTQRKIRKLDKDLAKYAEWNNGEYYSSHLDQVYRTNFLNSGEHSKDFKENFAKYDTGAVEYNYAYLLNKEETGINIIGYLGKEENFVVPETIGGLPVEYVDLTLKLNDIKFTSVTLPDTIKIIGPGCFADQEKMKKLILPKNLEKIESGAFSGSGLQEIVIPAGIITLSGFSGCKNLSKVTFEENSKLEKVDISCFNGCDSLTQIKLPDSVTEIGISAFSCKNLSEITIPDSVKIINNDAFYHCKGNEVLHIPSSIEKIGANAFSGWNDLKELDIPDSVTHMDIGLDYLTEYETSNRCAFDMKTYEGFSLKTRALLKKLNKSE